MRSGSKLATVNPTQAKAQQQRLLEALLGAGGRAVRLRQRHHAVRALEVGLQGLLVGGLQRVVQVLCLPAEVTVETPVTPGKHGLPVTGSRSHRRAAQDTVRDRPQLRGPAAAAARGSEERGRPP